MRGGAVEEGGMDSEQHQPTSSPAPPLPRSNKTPPLSAAPSQASLAPSELTVSDPDLSSPPPSSSVSLASSRPASSSSGVASPDIAAQPVTDIKDAVEEEVENDTQYPDEGHESITDIYMEDSISAGLMGTRIRNEALLRIDANMDGASSDIEEDYFEEYHLPNTHENAFVRHRSFRRKVELTPINAPDAEKIEGLVRTGEFERHGSMRRKIVPNVSGTDGDEVGLYKLDEREDEENKPSVIEFNQDFREIEKMMDDNGLGEVDLTDVERNESKMLDGLDNNDTPKLLLMRGKNAFTSTPNTAYASTADYASIDLSASLHDHSHSKKESSVENNDMESLSIEQSTINKVKDCLDFSKCKDIYSLTGKLQDILTAVEVEEVLNNSHRYVDYIDSGILEALFNSISEQMSISGQPLSISYNKNEDHIIKEEAREFTPEQVELQNKIKQKLLMEELAMDSLPYINVSEGEIDIPSERDAGPASVVMRPKKQGSRESSDSEGSRYSTIERRKSVRVSVRSAGNCQEEVEGVFIESDFTDTKLKKIQAPTIDLLNSGSQDDLDVSDSSYQDNNEDNTVSNKNALRVLDAYIEDGSHSSIPSIRITRTESSREEDGYADNSSVNNLYIGEEPFSPCSDATSLDFNEPGELCRPSNGNFTGEDSEVMVVEEALPDTSSEAVRSLPSQLLPPDLSCDEGTDDEERHWRSVVIGGIWRRIDMKVIEPYRKCISPGGNHCGHAVVVVSACQLPERARRDYSYVMDNLFLYLLSRLEQLVSDDYILVYLSGGRNVANTGPSFHWLKAAYQMIDRKLRKNLQALLVVHPTLWVRTIVALTRPFISSKFYRKLTFVYSLTELAQLIPLDQLAIPATVQEADFQLMIREKKKNVGRRHRPGGV